MEALKQTSTRDNPPNNPPKKPHTKPDSNTKNRHSGPLDFSRPQQYVDVGDHSLAYWCTGKGPDLVLVHGWPLHSATYRAMVPALAQHFTCHLLDLPGVGLTKSTAGAVCDFTHSVAALSAALQKLGIQQYSLLGHDSGAVIARLLAARDNHAVQGLVIAGSEIPGHYSMLLRLLLLIAKRPTAMQLFKRLLKIKLFRSSMLGFGSVFHNKNLIEGDFYDLFVGPMIENPGVLAGQSRLPHYISLSELDELKSVHQNLKVPVQLIWGEKDPFFPVKEARKMVSDLPAGSEFYVIRQASTFVHEECPEQFAELVTGYIHRVLSSQKAAD